MKPAILLLILARSLALFAGALGQEFSFENITQHKGTCGLLNEQKWSSQGSIILTRSDLIGFDPTVVINVKEQICSVDLRQCPPAHPPTPQQSCYCLSKSNDEYTVHVGSTLSGDSIHAGMTLQAVIPGRGPLKDISGVVDIGTLPAKTGLPHINASYKIDNGKAKELLDTQTVNICPDTRFLVEICVGDIPPTAELKISIGPKTVVTVGKCISVSHKFMPGQARKMTFTYEEPSCTHVKNVEFKDNNGDCINLKTIVAIDGICPDTLRLVNAPSHPQLLIDTVSLKKTWIVIQRRVAKADFYLPWNSYEHGFGNLTGSLWLGLEKIQKLCNQQTPCELLVHLQYAGTPSGSGLSKIADGCYYQHYDIFYLNPSSDQYALYFGSSSGTAGDGFRKPYSQRGGGFATYDKNNNKHLNCAGTTRSAWWYYYASCSGTDLNRGYWYTLGNVTFSEMKVRPKN